MYEKCLRNLFAIHVVRPGIENSARMATIFHHPELQYKVIHVAGTNGKGSTTFKISNILHDAGLKVGAFTSPHIYSFRERFRVNGSMISKDDTCRIVDRIMTSCAKEGISPTFFEVCTQLAFLHFAEQGCEYAVIETGLGGRLDSTNIVQPVASVITSIGWDHMAILGNSLEEIAGEKAGIIKSGVPVIVGPNVDGFESIKRTVKKVNTNLFPFPEGESNKSYAEKNSLLSKLVVKLLQKEGKIDPKYIINESILNNDPPLRYQQLTQGQLGVFLERLNGKFTHLPAAVIVDSAHNQSALEAVVHKLSLQFPKIPVRVCVGLSHERSPSVLEPIFTILGTTGSKQLRAFTYMSNNHPRVKPETHFLSEVNKMPLEGADWVAEMSSKLSSQKRGISLKNVLSESVSQAAAECGVVLITGTFFVMKDVMHTFNLGPQEQDTDSIEMNEGRMDNLKG
eukprot:Filipodium_phascolosomae@DN5772_c0_g1_i1.p1